MTDFADIGRRRIETGAGKSSEFPFAWSADTPYKATFEYAVDAFEEEVGFWSAVFGLETVTLVREYALFTTAAKDFWIAVRRADVDYPLSSPDGLSVMFMTQEMGSARSTLTARLQQSPEVRVELSGQEVVRCRSPFGLTIEIWQDPI
jgi:hypothetical protein